MEKCVGRKNMNRKRQHWRLPEKGTLLGQMEVSSQGAKREPCKRLQVARTLESRLGYFLPSIAWLEKKEVGKKKSKSSFVSHPKNGKTRQA